MRRAQSEALRKNSRRVTRLPPLDRRTAIPLDSVSHDRRLVASLAAEPKVAVTPLRKNSRLLSTHCYQLEASRFVVAQCFSMRLPGSPRKRSADPVSHSAADNVWVRLLYDGEPFDLLPDSDMRWSMAVFM